MYYVLAVGYGAGEFVSGQERMLAYPGGVDRGALPALTDRVTEALSAGGIVISILPRWSEGADLRRLQTIRAALDTHKLVINPVSLPPLAGSVFSALVAGVAAHVDTPGLLVGSLPALARQIIVVARLERLGGLSEPAPTVWQHAVSLVPGTRFGVSLQPHPSVVRLTRAHPLPPLPPAGGRSLALAAHGGATLRWAYERLVPATGNPGVVEVQPTPSARSWWGPGKGIEAVLYPTDVAATAAAVTADVALRPCDLCGLDSPAETCPFCGVRTSVSVPGPGPSEESVPDQGVSTIDDVGTTSVGPARVRRRQ